MHILTTMETFAEVVKAGSFTKAAEQMRSSKSFVSKQVSKLEADLGTKLLYRTTRKLSLTEEGERFYKHCRLIISEADKAITEIADSQRNPQGKIRITIPQSLIITDVGKVLLMFQKEYPKIELEVIVSGEFIDLVDNGIDLALRVGRLEDSTLISRKLADCSFQVVASPQYIEKWGRPDFPADLTTHNCLCYGHSTTSRNWLFSMPDGESTTVKVKGNISSNDGSFLVNAALESLGVCTGPSFLFKAHLETGMLCLLLSNHQQPTAISALYPYNQTLTRRVRALIDYLAENLEV